MSAANLLSSPASQAGLSYVEVLVATVLIAISLVPALEALQTGIMGAEIHQTLSEDHYRIAGRMEEVLTEPFSDLEAAAIAAGGSTTSTSYSLAAGMCDLCLVFLAAYDGDNADADGDPFTGTDADLLWVRVEMQNTAHALESLTSR